MIVIISQTIQAQTTIHYRSVQDYYDKENAVNWAVWKLLADRHQYPERNIDFIFQDGNIIERFADDGKSHKFLKGNGKTTLIINDAICGIAIRRDVPEETFSAWKNSDEPEKAEAVTNFLNAWQDYVDSDDLLSNNGWEKSDYANAGLPLLPRNEVPEYREELFWIPGAENVLEISQDGIVQSISQTFDGMHTGTGKPYLLSASPELITILCALSKEEATLVKQVLPQLRAGTVAFQNAFQRYPGLKNRLLEEFSVVESGIYTISARSPRGGAVAATIQMQEFGAKPYLQILQWQWL